MESADHPFADERQQQILDLVAARGRVRIGELTELFDVTERTIRKDLTELQGQRLLRRTHGGAIAVRPLVELHLDDRATHDKAAKDAIALACVRGIHDGDAIFIGSGTTAQRIANHLASDARLHARNLMILTNSLGVAHVIADQPGIDHVLLGGRVRTTGGCVVGPLARDELERFTVNIAFIGASALSESGISVAHLEEARVASTAIERARRVVVPLVHNKVGKAHFATICGLADLDTIVTDSADSYLHALCNEHNIDLVEAGPQPSSAEETAHS